jgi:hypothetical protein
LIGAGRISTPHKDRDVFMSLCSMWQEFQNRIGKFLRLFNV